jgi:hypothetical protein
LATALEWYAIHTTGSFQDLNSLPPSLRNNEQRKRKYVQVHPESIWHILQTSASSAVSTSQVIDVRKEDPDAGCHKSRARHWEAALVGMYKQRLSASWPLMNHICISADTSTHSYNDILLAVAYSWELQQACYPQCQVIAPGKTILPFEADLSEMVLLAANEGKLQRQSAYKQLQAIAHMTKQLNDKCLDDYDIKSAWLRPVLSEDERRVVAIEYGRRVAYIVDIAARTKRRILPVGLVHVPLLVVLLDQGSIGAAGSGWVDHLEK